jgi:hypothetical protein
MNRLDRIANGTSEIKEDDEGLHVIMLKAHLSETVK